MAQIQYKLGDVSTAVELYLMKIEKIEEEEDLVEKFCINMIACAASLPDLND